MSADRVRTTRCCTVSFGRRWYANELATRTGIPAQGLKTRLKVIVTRRNQIVHEADCDPTPPHPRWPIASQDTSDALDFIRTVVGEIDGLL